MKKFFAVFAIITMMSSIASANCPGDLNNDGTVGFADLTTILGGWGDCVDCPGDLNGDGTIGFADLTQVLGAWGDCPLVPTCDDMTGVDFNQGVGAPSPLGAVVIGDTCTMIFGTGGPADVALWANVGECEANCTGCIDNDECAADEYCNFAEFTCGEISFGSCELRAEVCAAIYDPVCTCEHQIASSLCHASAAGQAVLSLGECAPEDVCNYNGGTWNGDSCDCPAGTQFNFMRGCEAI